MQQHIQARHWQAVNKYHALCFCQSAPCAIVFALLSVAADKCIMLVLSLSSCTGGRRGKPWLYNGKVWNLQSLCNVSWGNWRVMCPCNVCRVGFSARGTCLSISFFLPLKGLHLAISLSLFKSVLPCPMCRTQQKIPPLLNPTWLSSIGSGTWC